MIASIKTAEKPGIRIERQGAALGAYIYDLDLSEPLNDNTFALVAGALQDHQAICLRGQNLTPEQHIAFTRRFGEVLITGRGMREHPEIGVVGGPSIAVERWHADSTHDACPLGLALMVAREVPEFGSDLIFANQHTAFDILSPAMQAMLGALRAVHNTTFKNGDAEENIHPVVRTHPVTGRKCLFVNGQYTRRIEGMTDAESQPLLDFLYQHCSQPRLTWRHYWKPGDVLVWDNINTQHFVVSDLPQTEFRWFHRTSVVGEVPV